MKERFRDFCGLYTEFYLRNLILPEITQGQDLEAVLIEFRPFIQVEFIVRNAVFKLGKDWSFTVICGNLNYDMFKTFCDLISPSIKVIKLDIDNLDQNGYNNLMLSETVWDLLTGKKVLIYQEDSFIFRSNVHEFLEWDYIGAPWPRHQNDNTKQVGNGGFSLRTLDIIKHIVKNIKNLPINSSTINYMRSVGLDQCPEDVYFSKAIIDLELGRVADFEIATRFSIESINCTESFGGHQFWLCEPEWLKRLHTSTVVQFQPNPGHYEYEHRGGWPDVVDYLTTHQFYNPSSDFKFFDVLEHKFLWETHYYCESRWSGIIHCTQKTPAYLNCVNIEFMFNNANFIRSLDNCILLITTSEYTRKYIEIKLKEHGKNTQTICILHPIKDHGAPCFNVNRFRANTDKKIIQIGQQLRIMSSIYLIDKIDFKRVWLTGTRNYSHVERLINHENKVIDRSLVEMYYTETVEEYDNLLTENVVFLHLFDAAANNTVLECIVRNTPIIVNKIDAVVEYLGEGYPLYFNELSEVPALIDRIEEAHIYLKKMDKTKIGMDYFYKRLLTSINYAVNGRSLDLIPVYPYRQNLQPVYKPRLDLTVSERYNFGKHTYGEPQVFHENENATLKVGNFCQFGNSVSIYLGKPHQSGALTSYPFGHINQNIFNYVPKIFSKGDVVIGNDVNIKNNVTIMSGITIGDGAVIEPYTVVVKNVDPYTVVGGNDQSIRSRFEHEQINRLQSIKWWDWTDGKINRYMDILNNGDMDLLNSLPSIKIVDAFIFYNEIDMLKYRLNILNSVVDYFVIVESSFTFVGNSKKLYYNDHKHEFEKFADKIIHIVVDDLPCIPPNIEENEQWLNEKFQRNCIDRGIKKLKLDPYDVIVVADVDEIPDPLTLQQIKNETIEITVNPLEMDFYYYNLQSRVVDKWLHCKILTYKKYLSFPTCEQIRFSCWEPVIKNGGWHLSYFGDAEFISNKIENFSHQEYNNPSFNTIPNIENSINNFTSIFSNRHIKIEKIETIDNEYLPPYYPSGECVNTSCLDTSCLDTCCLDTSCLDTCCLDTSKNFVINN